KTSEVFASDLPSDPGESSRSTMEPACSSTPSSRARSPIALAIGPSTDSARSSQSRKSKAVGAHSSGRTTSCGTARSAPAAAERTRSAARAVRSMTGSPSAYPSWMRETCSCEPIRSASHSFRLAAPLGEHLVVGDEFSVAIATRLPILALGLEAVLTHPVAGHHEGEDESRDLPDTPGDLAGSVLVSPGVGQPGQVEVAEEVGRQQVLGAGEDDPEEGMEGDRHAQQDEEDERAPPTGPGSEADEHPGEQITGEQEAHHHHEMEG